MTENTLLVGDIVNLPNSTRIGVVTHLLPPAEFDGRHDGVAIHYLTGHPMAKLACPRCDSGDSHCPLHRRHVRCVDLEGPWSSKDVDYYAKKGWLVGDLAKNAIANHCQRALALSAEPLAAFINRIIS